MSSSGGQPINGWPPWALSGDSFTLCSHNRAEWSSLHCGHWSCVRSLCFLTECKCVHVFHSFPSCCNFAYRCWETSRVFLHPLLTHAIKKPEGFWPLNHMWHSSTSGQGSGVCCTIQQLLHFPPQVRLLVSDCLASYFGAPVCPSLVWRSFQLKVYTLTKCSLTLHNLQKWCESGSSIRHFRSYSSTVMIMLAEQIAAQAAHVFPWG